MKIFNTLSFKLAFSFFMVLSAIIMLSLLITAYLFKANLNTYVRQSPLSIAESVKEQLESELSGDVSLNDIAKKIEELSVKYGAEIVIYDQRGTPLIVSGARKSVCETPWCEGPMGAANARTVTVPLVVNGNLFGFVGVIVNRQTSIVGALTRFQQSMFYSLIFIGVFVLAVSMLVFYLVSKRIVEPITLASEVAHRISEGDYSVKLESTDDSEIKTLHEALNLLAARLKQIEERRMELASDIAHEFKTPLSVIKANLEAIRDGVVSAEPSRVNKLIEEVDHLSKLLEELKTIQMLDDHQAKPNLEILDLGKFIEEMLHIYKPLAESKGLSVDSNLQKIFIKADKAYLQRIFENIFLNSVNYTESGGRISVRSYPMDSFGVLEVEDTGIGIKKEDMPFIFDRFYRAESSRSRRTGGSGLGLAIVKKLIESLEGKVEVESEYMKGTKVRVMIPMSAENR